MCARFLTLGETRIGAYQKQGFASAPRAHPDGLGARKPGNTAKPIGLAAEYIEIQLF